MGETASRRVRFLADFNYLPVPAVTIAYKAGTVAYVRRDCAERALAAGKAELVTMPMPPSGLAQAVRRKRRTRSGAAPDGEQ